MAGTIGKARIGATVPETGSQKATGNRFVTSSLTFDLQAYIKDLSGQVDQALETYLPEQDDYLGSIGQAMRYSVFPGGKRFRPVICLASCQALGKPLELAMAPACAFELLHCFSLIHDDLPCMDNDDERRGRPTNHKVFGEAVALLAGDGLSIWAFQVATMVPSDVPPASTVQLVRELALASGHPGMVGGQVIDLLGQQTGHVDAALLSKIHANKTGALIRGAARCGALVAGASSDELERITQYAERVGLVFQITDDILDAATDPEPVSFPAIYGMEESKRMAKVAVEEALEYLAPFGVGADPLRALATYLLSRET